MSKRSPEEQILRYFQESDPAAAQATFNLIRAVLKSRTTVVESTVTPARPHRKRRTKKEMELAKNTAAVPPGSVA